MAPTADQIDRALRGLDGPIALDYRYEQRTTAFAFLADVTGAVLDHEVRTNNDADGPCRTASFQIRPALIAESIAEGDLIAITALLTVRGGDVAEIPVGLFRLDVPEETYEGDAAEWSVEGTETTVLLQRAQVADPYTIEAGSNFVSGTNGIAALIASVGLLADIPATSSVLPVGKTWAPGTAKLAIVDELLEAINYYPAYSSRTGVITSKARPNYATAPATLTLYDTETAGGLLLDPVRIRKDSTRFANRVAVVIDDPARVPAVALRLNDDPDAPNGYSALGDVLIDFPEISGALVPTVVPDAEAIADYVLRREAARTVRATIQTVPDPRREPHEIYALETTISAGYQWRVLATRSGPRGMTHELARAQDLTLTGNFHAYLASLEPDGWWPLGDPVGAALDASGNGNNGTVTLGAGVRSVSPLDYGGDGALTFDGSATRVTVTDAAVLQNVWDAGGAAVVLVTPGATGAARMAIVKRSGGGNGWRSFLDSLARFTFWVDFSGTDGTWYVPTALAAGDGVVVVYDSSSVANAPTIYVWRAASGSVETLTVANGGVVVSTTPVGTRTSDVGVDLGIGHENGGAGSTANGTLDEVALFATAPSSDSILALLARVGPAAA